MSIYIQDYDSVNGSKDVFAVNASFAADRDMSTATLNNLWADHLGFRSSIIPGTIKAGAKAPNGQMVSFLAKANTASVSQAEAGDRFQAVASNVFMDPKDETLWSLENGRLVQAAQENLGDLLQARLARTQGTMIFASATLPFNHGMRPEIFDFGVYYNTNDKDYDAGFMIADGNQVIVSSMRHGGELVFTDPSTVLGTVNVRQDADQSTLPEALKAGMGHVGAMLGREREKMVMANLVRYGTVEPGNTHVKTPESGPQNDYATSADFNSHLCKQVLNYMGGLYSGSDYYGGLEKWIKSRLNTANEDRPITTMRAA